MPKVAVYNMSGKPVSEIELSDLVFGATIHEHAIHSVVRAQLNAKRQGTQAAKTRTEVRGGGRKIYRQKGTGNARHHGRRAPQFTHGGVVFAPKPRSLAMCGALTSKVVDNDLIVLDKLEVENGKTRVIAKMLKDLGATRKALIVTAGSEEMVNRATANIQGVKAAHVSTINVLDILGYDKFIVTEEAVRLVEEVYE